MIYHHCWSFTFYLVQCTVLLSIFPDITFLYLTNISNKTVSLSLLLYMPSESYKEHCDSKSVETSLSYKPPLSILSLTTWDPDKSISHSLAGVCVQAYLFISTSALRYHHLCSGPLSALVAVSPPPEADHPSTSLPCCLRSQIVVAHGSLPSRRTHFLLAACLPAASFRPGAYFNLFISVLWM
jgi:hypothetical protein